MPYRHAFRHVHRHVCGHAVVEDREVGVAVVAVEAPAHRRLGAESVYTAQLVDGLVASAVARLNAQVFDTPRRRRRRRRASGGAHLVLGHGHAGARALRRAGLGARADLAHRRAVLVGCGVAQAVMQDRVRVVTIEAVVALAQSVVLFERKVRSNVRCHVRSNVRWGVRSNVR